MTVHEKLAEYDEALRLKHGPYICGCDEVGRGAWSGPLVSAACILAPGASIPGLRDSKQLTKTARDELALIIQDVALAYAVEAVSPEEIDKGGLDPANTKAMQDASRKASGGLVEASGNAVSLYVVDQCPGFFLKPSIMLPKADGLSLSVAAASVLAKTARDTMMEAYALAHPEYGWDVSHGYITEHHKEAVLKYGFVDGLHRRSFSVSGVNKPKQVTIFDL